MKIELRFPKKGVAGSCTVSTKVCNVVNDGLPESLTAMVMLAVPATVVLGKSFTVQLVPVASVFANTIFESDITPGLSELAATVNVSGGASTSPMVKLMGLTGTPARVICLSIKDINGGSLTGVTRSVNELVALNPLSFCAIT